MYLNFKLGKKFICSFLIILVLACSTFLYSGILPNTKTVDANVEERSLPIIMYHSILKDKKYQGQFVISPEQFEEDLKLIKKNGYTTITVNDLIDYVNNKNNLPEKCVMLTFDDGYYNNYLYAYPLLKKYNCCAVISPIAYFSEQYSNCEDKPSAYYFNCNWEQLKEMSNSKCFEIQNHSYNLHSQSGRIGIKKKSSESNDQYNSIITDDIQKAQNILKEKVGVTPTAFVYPFGAMSETSEEIIKSMNFQCTMTCEEKINHITRDKSSLYMLSRFIRTNKISVENIFSTLEII